MTVIEWEDFIARNPLREPTAMTIGVFDGVHRGHQALIRNITSPRLSTLPLAITFRSNPKSVMRPDLYEGDITSLASKISLLEAYGVRIVVLIDFSGNFSKLGGKEFVDLLKDRGNLRYLTVGSDFRCGHRLDTDAGLLQSMNMKDGIPTDVVAPVLMGGLPISSSRIRTAIAAGDLVEATALLGRNVDIDLADVPTTPGPGKVFFDVRAAHRITPPNGRYSAVLYGRQSLDRATTQIDIESGVVAVPSGIDAQRVEFIIETSLRNARSEKKWL